MSSPFPLAPFLASLAGDGLRSTLDDCERIALTLRCGGPWSKDRLRGILLSILVRNEDQEVLFRKRFAEFFDLTDAQEEAFAEVDVERALDDLRRLAGEWRPRWVRPRHERRRAKPQAERRWPRKALWALSVLILLALALSWWNMSQDSAPPVAPTLELSPLALGFGNQLLDSETVREVKLTNRTAVPLTVVDTHLTGFAQQDYEARPSPCSQAVLAPMVSCRIAVVFTPREEGLRSAFLRVVTMEGSVTTTGLSGTGIRDLGPDHELLDDQAAWQRPAALAALLLLAIVGTWLWRRHKPVDQAPAWNADRPRLFRPGTIGAAPAPWLEREVLDQLADSLGYFQSELPGKRLDVPASVRATAESGGVPGMIFQQRRQVRRVLILEDVFAEARAFNPIAGELAAGLAQRGVPVVHGLFRGVPESFRTADGSFVHLEDLEDDRRGYLVLVFSDGKGIHPRHDAYALETLARWPNMAWLELRERRGWDESTAFVARLGLPVFPASREGLLTAMERFATERAPQADFSSGSERWRGLPLWTPGTTLAKYVEHLLGDSLPWAQACAMAMPPVGLGLADALRRRFFAELPPERIERLLALPNSFVNAAGLELSKEVLAVLRTGFAARQSETAQRRILNFLLAEIRKAEPADRESPEHQAWEWRYGRVRLELDPDAALKLLSELEQGPLGNSIRAELAEVVLASEAEAGALVAIGIPLRVKPQTHRGWQRLSILAPGARVPRRRPAISEGADVGDDVAEADGHQQLRLTSLSPFQTAGALPPGSPLFVGREAELGFIKNRIRKTSILIVGSRRVGKTSLLNQVYYWAQHSLDLEPIFVDLQNIQSHDAFIRALRDVSDSPHLHKQVRKALRELSGDVRAALRSVAKVARSLGRLAVFLFNEVDALAREDRGLITLWRALNDEQLARFVMTGYSVISRMGDPGSPFFHFTEGSHFGRKAIALAAITRPAAKNFLDLLTESDLGLRWASLNDRDRAYDWLLNRSYCIPWVLQVYGQLLVEHLQRKQRVELRLSDIEHVLDAEGQLVWQYIDAIDYRSLDAQSSDQALRHGYQLVLFAMARHLYFLGGAKAPIRDPQLRERVGLSFSVAEARALVKTVTGEVLV